MKENAVYLLVSKIVFFDMNLYFLPASQIAHLTTGLFSIKEWVG